MVRVHPGARRDAIAGFMADGTLKVSVTAPPEGGRANTAVCTLLAEALDLPLRAVTLVGGAGARAKTVSIEGIGPEEARRRLAAACGA